MSFSRLTTDLFFFCPTRTAALLLSNHTQQQQHPNNKKTNPNNSDNNNNNNNNLISTYLFIFEHSPYRDPMNNNSFCYPYACHGAEVAYVFHSEDFSGFHFVNPQESELSWQTLGFWTQFAGGQQLQNWPQFDAGMQRSMLLDIPLQGKITSYYISSIIPSQLIDINCSYYYYLLLVTSRYHGKECDYWESIGYREYHPAILKTLRYHLSYINNTNYNNHPKRKK